MLFPMAFVSLRGFGPHSMMTRPSSSARCGNRGGAEIVFDRSLLFPTASNTSITTDYQWEIRSCAEIQTAYINKDAYAVIFSAAPNAQSSSGRFGSPRRGP
jgi:hypothetical protein